MSLQAPLERVGASSSWGYHPAMPGRNTNVTLDLLSGMPLAVLGGFLGLLLAPRELQRTSLGVAVTRTNVDVPEFWTIGPQRVLRVQMFKRSRRLSELFQTFLIDMSPQFIIILLLNFSY
jgi:hypothetical protein